MIDTTPWLGPAGADLTAEQREHFDRLVALHHEQIVTHRPAYGTGDYHPADYEDDDTAAWVAAFEIAAGEFDLIQRGRAYRAAQTAAYQGAIIATLDGMSEVKAAEAAWISRPTLRKALGK